MKIQLKRSNVLDGGSAKEPTAAQMEYGELAVNYNTADPSIFIKDSDNNIVNIIDTATPPGDGTITIKQPGAGEQTFTVNQTGNTEINLLNDNTIVTPGNGALSIASFGSGDTSTGSYTANQSGAGTVTLPQISYTDLKDKPSITTPGAGVITIKQPGTDDQSFNVNQSGPTEINLKNDNTVVTPGAGVITIKQPGVSEQSFNVNQSGPTEINLKNDNTNTTYTANNGVQLTGTNFTADTTVVRTSGAQSIAGPKTFSSNLQGLSWVGGTYFQESVYNIPFTTLFELNPTNGESQFVTLTENATPIVLDFNNGASLTLHITANSFAIDWGTADVVWLNGSAPDLAATGKTVIQFWRGQNFLYGALVGELA